MEWVGEGSTQFEGLLASWLAGQLASRRLEKTHWDEEPGFQISCWFLKNMSGHFKGSLALILLAFNLSQLTLVFGFGVGLF